MLIRFLQTLQNGEMQSLTGIARSLGIPTTLVLQMAQDLTGKGYLQEAGTDCDTPQNACSDCPVTSSCHTLIRHWFLTEKGKRALAR
jgi:hypothetical protein